MVLEVKFGTDGLDLFETIKDINDLKRIQFIKTAVKKAVNFDEVSRLI